MVELHENCMFSETLRNSAVTCREYLVTYQYSLSQKNFDVAEEKVYSVLWKHWYRIKDQGEHLVRLLKLIDVLTSRDYDN